MLSSYPRPDCRGFPAEFILGYDGLVEQLGGKACPAVGFAMGVERLVLLLDELGVVPDSVGQTVDVYLVAVGDVDSHTLVLAEKLRTACPTIRLQTNCGGGSFKSQMKKAGKSGAAVALVLGDDEAANKTVGVKLLRQDKAQETVGQEQLADYLTTLITTD